MALNPTSVVSLTLHAQKAIKICGYLRYNLHLFCGELQIFWATKRAIFGSFFLHEDIKGKTCCPELNSSILADLWPSQPFFREDTFLPREPRRVSPVAMASWLLYTSQNLPAPPASLPTGFSRSSPSAQRNFNNQQQFSAAARPIMVKRDTMVKPGTASPPL